MSLATCNGLDIVSARFTFRLQGAWDAELAVNGESAEPVSGALSIVVDGQTLRATATRSEADSGGLVTVQAIGGAGGLGTAVPSLGYVSTTRRLVIVNALSLGGESLDGTSSARLDEYLPHWTRSAGTVGDAVRAQAKSLGMGWRVLPSGSVWVGEETWPTVSPEHTLEAERPTADALAIAVDGFDVLPGSTFLGRKVREVEYRLDGSTMRASVSYGESPRGELADLIGTFVRRELPVETLTMFRARVVGQNGDTTLELTPTDSRMPPMSRVPIRVPAGVTSVEVPNGTFALVQHENGDPSKPVVVGFEAGAATLVQHGSSPSPVALAPILEAYVLQMDAFLQAIRVQLAVIGPVAGNTALPPAPIMPPGLASTEIEVT